MMPYRFLTITVMLASAAGLLYARPGVDRVPPSQPLDQIPQSISGLASRDIPIDSGVLKLLGSGSFLNRVYLQPQITDQEDDVNAIGLFIAYFPTQRTGQAIHSPQNCLPGAGWSFVSSRHVTVANMHGDVGEYVITNGSVQQLVLYWYRAHGRSIANDYLAKAYMLADAIRYNRTDGALVRVITPIQPGETTQAAHLRATGFASRLAPILPAYIPD